jgi:hypothetical protein
VRACLTTVSCACMSHDGELCRAPAPRPLFRSDPTDDYFWATALPPGVRVQVDDAIAEG